MSSEGTSNISPGAQGIPHGNVDPNTPPASAGQPQSPDQVAQRAAAARSSVGPRPALTLTQAQLTQLETRLSEIGGGARWVPAVIVGAIGGAILGALGLAFGFFGIGSNSWGLTGMAESCMNGVYIGGIELGRKILNIDGAKEEAVHAILQDTGVSFEKALTELARWRGEQVSGSTTSNIIDTAQAYSNAFNSRSTALHDRIKALCNKMQPDDYRRLDRAWTSLLDLTTYLPQPTGRTTVDERLRYPGRSHQPMLRTATIADLNARQSNLERWAHNVLKIEHRIQELNARITALEETHGLRSAGELSPVSSDQPAAAAACDERGRPLILPLLTAAGIAQLNTLGNQMQGHT